MRLYLYLLIIPGLLSACSPYAHGPKFTIEQAQNTFRPVVEFMEIERGMAVADVGAGSGVLTIIMSTQMDSCEVYIQDIDRDLLNRENVDKIVGHYSGKLGYDLGRKHTYHLVHGTQMQSNLPDQAVDVIYSNATLHVFDYPDSMLQDLRRKLKPEGRIFFRDGFRGDHGEGEYCSSKECGKRLLSIEEFLRMMTGNGFRLVKQIPDLQGYPVFGFAPED